MTIPQRRPGRAGFPGHGCPREAPPRRRPRTPVELAVEPEGEVRAPSEADGVVRRRLEHVVGAAPPEHLAVGFHGEDERLPLRKRKEQRVGENLLAGRCREQRTLDMT